MYTWFGILIVVVLFIAYCVYKTQTQTIDRTDPEDMQKLMDLKRLKTLSGE